MASTTSNEGPPALLTIYKKIYGSFANPNICKQNDFSIFQNYYLQKEIPVAMAGKMLILREEIRELLEIVVHLLIFFFFKYRSKKYSQYLPSGSSKVPFGFIQVQ